MRVGHQNVQEEGDADNDAIENLPTHTQEIQSESEHFETDLEHKHGQNGNADAVQDVGDQIVRFSRESGCGKRHGFLHAQYPQVHQQLCDNDHAVDDDKRNNTDLGNQMLTQSLTK